MKPPSTLLLGVALLLNVNNVIKSSPNDYAGSSFNYIKEEFYAHNAWGLHTTIDLKNCNPELIRSADAIRDYVIQLCDLIEMIRFGDPIIVNFSLL